YTSSFRLHSPCFLPRASNLFLASGGGGGAAAMDKSMLSDLDGLPEEDKMRMAAMIDQLQIRDSLRMYNSLVERCFTDCVDTFRRKTLDKQEESCVRRCAEKFLKHSMRVGMRFAELNQGVATPD
ncbi:unnamed protein product, partial [Urochloa humidicola]